MGARTAIVGPLLIALGAMVIGNVPRPARRLPTAALVDAAIMRSVDLVYALPALLVAIVVVGVLGGGYFLAVGPALIF